MGLEEVDEIDMISPQGPEGRYGLIITDRGVTTDPGGRLALLKRKLLTYREMMASGQLAEVCPGAGPEDFFIQVICRHQPTSEMRNITHVLIKTEPPIEIPVVFTAFPEEEWNAEDDAAKGSLSDEMREAVRAAFEAATELLADDQIPRFIYWHDGEERKLAAISDARNQDEVVQRVTTWASRPGNGACLCIQMSAVKTGNGPLPVDALLARCCERGEKEGFILTQEVGVDGRTGNLLPQGKVRFVEQCRSFFPVD